MNDPRIGYCPISNTDLSKILQQGLYTYHKANLQYDWMICLDDDEYLSLPRGLATVPYFLNFIPEYADQFGVYWQPILSKEHIDTREGTYIDTFQYVKSAPQQIEIKTFVRKRCIGQYVHPHRMLGDNLNCYTVLGRAKDTDWSGSKFRSSTNDWVKIYHFNIRSREEYNAKIKYSLATDMNATMESVGCLTFEEAHNGFDTYDDTLLKAKQHLGI